MAWGTRTSIGNSLNDGSPASISFTVTNAVSSGSLIVVAVTVDVGGSTTSPALSDTKNTWHLAKQSTQVGTVNVNTYLYYAYNCVALTTSDVITFTCNDGGRGNMGHMAGFFVTGTGASDPLNTSSAAAANGSGTPFTTTSGTPVTVGELFVGAIGVVESTVNLILDSNYSTPPVGGNTSNVATFDFVAGNRINLTTAAQTFTCTSGGGIPTDWASVLVSFVLPSAAQTVVFIDAQNVTVGKRKIVSDNLTAPPQTVSTSVPTPSAYGYQTVDGGVKRKIRYVPEPFAFAPVAYVPTPSVFGYQTVDGAVKRKIRYLPEALALAPAAYVPTPSAFGYQTVDGAVKRKIRYVPEPFASVPVTYVPTPSEFGYQTVDGGIKRKIRYLPEAFAFAPVPYTTVPTPSDFGYQTEGGPSRRVVRSIPEAMAAFVRGDVPIVPAAAQKDGDPDYWKLPWFNVEGGSFAESLRTRAITALEEAATLAEQAEPAKAKRAARKAAKGLQEYAKTGGALLSDDLVLALDRTAKQLRFEASQWNRSGLIERVSNARMALLAYEAALQDEEDALIALMVN